MRAQCRDVLLITYDHRSMVSCHLNNLEAFRKQVVPTIGLVAGESISACGNFARIKTPDVFKGGGLYERKIIWDNLYSTENSTGTPFSSIMPD